MNKLARAGIALAFAAFALPVAAQQEMRPYLSGGYGYVFEDNSRNSDRGQGYFFGAGKAINQYWGLEFGGFYNQFNNHSGTANQWREYGGKLDGLFFYSRDPAFSPYFGLGVGGVQSDLKTKGGSSFDPFVDAGIGFFKYFTTETGNDLGIRADLRYRWIDTNAIPGIGSFEEPVMRIGLVLPMGPRPGAAAATTANDADGDGVPDSVDNCPGTPAGVAVDARGCPLDSDRDGVPDSLDKCPGTAAGLSVDANGCAIGAANAGPNRSFENTHFAFDKADLTDYAKAILDNAATVIGGLAKKYPSLKVDISGHTDWIGTDAYNQALSERRANVVKNYLTRKGVDASRISTFAYGETKPVAPNDTEEGRALNRRAEIRTHE